MNAGITLIFVQQIYIQFTVNCITYNFYRIVCVCALNKTLSQAYISQCTNTTEVAGKTTEYEEYYGYKDQQSNNNSSDCSTTQYKICNQSQLVFYVCAVYSAFLCYILMIIQCAFQMKCMSSMHTCNYYSDFPCFFGQ